jgi:exodeoxyribonuclease V
MQRKEYSNRFESYLLNCFPYEPTDCQRQAIRQLSDYLFDPGPAALFLLKGYAGTGKTSLISSFVKVLDEWRIKNRLLAPTGRAAKVLGGYSGKQANTIHRFLYLVFTSPDGKTVIVPRTNKSGNTVFIVDEVSMISGHEQAEDELAPFRERNLLNDLIQYVFSAENCKMVFIGDQAQLPPVGSRLSPAMEEQALQKAFGLEIRSFCLEEVVRQEALSGILHNATNIRKKIASGLCDAPLITLFKKDVVRLQGMDLMDELSGAFTGRNSFGSVVITRSNKRANLYNQEIRNRILGKENEIEGGDLMMVVKNNYYWLPEDSQAGFIANGDLIEILRVRNITEKYGFVFADALIQLADYPEEQSLEVKILLSAIYSESASLPRASQIALYNAVLDEIREESGNARQGGVSSHPWYNALQVKFAYALTCHKTQGGQWDQVFLDQGWLTMEMLDADYFRWLYTAVTRATRKLFLAGFQDDYLEKEPEDDECQPF